MKNLEQILINFLKNHHEKDRSLLLGLSGGPDSLALFYLLLSCRKKIGLNFSVAHVDHNWRSESSTEAVSLQNLAKHHQVPFHLKTLHPSLLKGNLEAICRLERLAFFQELCQQKKYQAVLLGHHADDHAETVLKRLLEGANLLALYGLSPAIVINGVKLWRPFLNIEKKSILNWLKEREIVFFSDETNFNPKFLRAKLRLEIIPRLSKEFGKEVSKSLCHLGAEALELREYFDAVLKKYLRHVQQCSLGVMLDLSQECPEYSFEVKDLVRQFCKRENCFLSREQIELVSRGLHNEEANRCVSIGKKTVFIDRRRIFLLNWVEEELPITRLALKPGNFSYGHWKISVKEVKERPEKYPEFSWKDLWKDGLEVFLPAEQTYFLGSPFSAGSYGKFRNVSLDKWWTNHKVPAFLRRRVPVIWQDDQIQVELLSEVKREVYFKNNFPEGWLQVKISGWVG